MSENLKNWQENFTMMMKLQMIKSENISIVNLIILKKKSMVLLMKKSLTLKWNNKNRVETFFKSD